MPKRLCCAGREAYARQLLAATPELQQLARDPLRSSILSAVAALWSTMLGAASRALCPRAA
jgi:hypothetical protein